MKSSPIWVKPEDVQHSQKQLAELFLHTLPAAPYLFAFFLYWWLCCELYLIVPEPYVLFAKIAFKEYVDSGLGRLRKAHDTISSFLAVHYVNQVIDIVKYYQVVFYDEHCSLWICKFSYEFAYLDPLLYVQIRGRLVNNIICLGV